jgi:tripartite-type tricarboxylate transporter receptor subunit TctC
LLGQHLAARYGQPVLVESRAGANAAIAASAVAAAPPNGLTLLLSHSAVLFNTIILPKPPYRMTDFAPVILIAKSPIAFAVNAQVPARNMREFIALVKANPKTYNYATPGAGSVANFMGESLNISAGLDMTHVPYRGSAATLVDLIGGQVYSAFSDISSVAREEQATGKVRVLGVTGANRFKLYPNVPTFSEQGLSQMDLPAWHGVFAPAATPPAIVDELAREFARIIQIPEVSARIYELGFEPSGVTGSAVPQYFQQTGKVIEDLFRSGRIRLE